MQIIDKRCESEHDPKGSYRTGQTVDQDELEIFTEILLLEVITPREDHGRQQPIEKDLLVEVHLGNVVEVVQESSEDDAD